jgi:hypothetical protein
MGFVWQYIVQVVNNTSGSLYYYSPMNNNSVTIPPKTELFEKNGWIPSSDLSGNLDPIPPRGYNLKAISFRVGDGHLVEIR